MEDKQSKATHNAASAIEHLANGLPQTADELLETMTHSKDVLYLRQLKQALQMRLSEKETQHREDAAAADNNTAQVEQVKTWSEQERNDTSSVVEYECTVKEHPITGPYVQYPESIVSNVTRYDSNDVESTWESSIVIPDSNNSSVMSGWTA